jgi:RNA polymerase sigma factor for flagellar operon FliA
MLPDDDVYSAHAETIEAVITAVCRRHRLSADQGEELASRIRLKLIDHDFAVLRQFQGRSSIRTYLITVSERVLLDWRTSEWGKWRPCQEARRLGPVAIELDRLLTRDGVAFEAAVETLVAKGWATRAELDEIRPNISARSRRWMVSGDVLEQMPATAGAADARVADAERDAQVSKAGAALASALRTLPPEDQIILKLRFRDGFTIARIAQLIGEESKPLYRRFEKLFAHLRQRLSELGVSQSEVSELLGHESLELAPAFTDAPPGNQSPRPSTRITPGGRHA